MERDDEPLGNAPLHSTLHSFLLKNSLYAKLMLFRRWITKLDTDVTEIAIAVETTGYFT
jgi:hypothetical protein